MPSDVRSLPNTTQGGDVMGSIERRVEQTVVVGVDPHPGSHTACAMDGTGRELGQWRAKNDH